MNNKAMHPALATALLLIVGVLAVASFQHWNQAYQKNQNIVEIANDNDSKLIEYLETGICESIIYSKYDETAYCYYQKCIENEYCKYDRKEIKVMIE